MPRWGFDTPMVGRADELTRLDSAMTRSGVVLVGGDAGVGKTRLLTEVVRDFAGTVLVGHCVDLGELGLPYLPFSELLGELAEDRADLLAAHPAAERLLRGAQQDGEVGKLEVYEAVAGLLAELAADAPVLLVLEDLHWADASTRDLLRFLLSRRPDRLAVLATYRTDDLHRRHPLRPVLAELVRLPGVDRLQLSPLPDSEVASLVRGLPGDLPSDEVDSIVRRAEGNAFYAEELAAATLDSDDRAVPGGLADVLLTRLEALPGAAQRVVRIAAVAGRQVEHGLLRDVAGLPDDELDAALREAINRHLLVADETGGYAFRHALLREAAYGDLLPGERVRLHAAFGGLASSAAARAYHFQQANDLPRALTASYEAADEARRLGAPTEELRHLETVLTLVPAVPDSEVDEVAVTLRASRAAAQAGEPHRAVALTRSALDFVGSDPPTDLAARIRYLHAQNLMSIESDRSAFEQSRAALELMTGRPASPTLAWAASTHARAAFFTGDLTEAARLGGEAMRVAEEVGEDGALADAVMLLSRVEESTGHQAEALAGLDRVRAIADRAGDPALVLRAVYNLAAFHHRAGRYAEVVRAAEQGLPAARAAGLHWGGYGVELRYLQVLALYGLGRWDEAVRASALTRPPAAALHIAAAGLHVAVGRGLPTAPAQVDAALAAGPEVMAQVACGPLLIDLRAWAEDAPAALAAIRRMDDLLTPYWGDAYPAQIRSSALALSAYADAAGLARLAGDSAALEAHLAEADRLAERARRGTAGAAGALGPEGRAWLARVEAEVLRARGSTDGAVEAWWGVVDAFDYGEVYEQARSRRRLAELLLAAEDRPGAEAAARSAYEVARSLGAVPLRTAVEALARRGRLDLGSGSGRAEDLLTPREQDVLALLARGLSNRQIGKELFISDKTASVHVSNILAKLSAASRTEAVAVAHRRGLIPT